MSFLDVLQLVATVVSIVALMVTIEFSRRAIHVAKQDSVVQVFLVLSGKLQDTLYGALSSERDLLKMTGVDLQPHLIHIYRLIDVFADMHHMKALVMSYDANLWKRSEARMTRLLERPALQDAWARQLKKNREIFDGAFVEFVEGIRRTGAQNAD